MKIHLNSASKSIRITKHILFWFVYITLNTLMYGKARGDYFLQFKLQLLYLPVVLGATYTTLYFLIPHFLLKKKHLQFIAYFILTMLVFSILQRMNITLFVVPTFFPDFSIASFTTLTNPKQHGTSI